MNDSPFATPDFATLARDWTPALLRYLRHQSGDDALAEDLLQETLLKIARGLDGYAGRASLKTWVYAIASNVFTDHLRRSRPEREFIDLGAAADIADPGAAPDERMEFDAMNRCVRSVIDSLSPIDRAVLILHELEGLDCAQTASVLGVAPGAARVRLHRARERLAAALGRRCTFYHDREQVLRCEPFA